MRQRVASLVVVAAAATLPYLSTLGFGFVWDDQWTISENITLREPARLAGLLRLGGARAIPDGQRPVFVLDEVADFALWGARPAPWHAESVAWHGALAMVGALVAEAWLDAPLLPAGLLFALHPAHVEAVAAVNYREDLLCGTFLCAALLAVVQRRATGRRRWLALTGLLSLLALGSKETALVLPLALVALDLARAAPGQRRSALRAGLPDVLITACASALAVGWAAFATGGAPQSLGAGTPHGPLLALATVGRQLARTLVPWGLGPEQVVDATAALWPRALLSAAALGVGLWRGPRRHLAFALPFLLPTLPLLAVHNPLADRHLLLPSLAAAALLAALPRRLPAPTSRWLALAPVAAGYVLLLARDAPIWRNERTLFAAAVARAPDSPRAHLALARVFQADGHFAAARPHIERALALDPTDGDAFMTRAIGRGASGDLAGSLADLDRARALGVTQPGRLASNRGYVLHLLGRHVEALAEADAAVRLTPGLAKAHWIRSLVLGALGRVDEARAEAATVLRLEPGHGEARRMLGAE